jgi:2'-5' RNA ligase
VSARPNRLFVALDLPAAAVAALAAFRAAAAEPGVWRAVPDASLHVTLAFMGPREEGAVERAGEAIREAAAPVDPPRLALAGTLLLPPRRPKVLCAALDDPDGTLATLQARVSDALAAAGLYTPEARAFRAHVTVARLRPRARAPRAVPADPEPLDFTATTVTLVASRLHPSGARYEPLVRVALA